MLFQPFWPQTDPSTQKSYTTDWTYLRFFKLKLSGYPQFRKQISKQTVQMLSIQKVSKLSKVTI